MFEQKRNRAKHTADSGMYLQVLPALGQQDARPSKARLDAPASPKGLTACFKPRLSGNGQPVDPLLLTSDLRRLPDFVIRGRLFSHRAGSLTGLQLPILAFPLEWPDCWYYEIGRKIVRSNVAHEAALYIRYGGRQRMVIGHLVRL